LPGQLDNSVALPLPYESSVIGFDADPLFGTLVGLIIAQPVKLSPP